MSYMRISAMLIGIVIVGVLVYGISLYWLNLESEYGNVVSDSSMSTFNESMDQLTNISKEMNKTMDSLEAAQEPEGILDKLGGLASNLWKTTKLTLNSADILTRMINSGVSLMGLGPIGTYLIAALSSIAVIAFLFVLLYFIFKVKG